MRQEIVQQLKSELRENVKEAGLVKSECTTMEHACKERCKETLNELLEDIGVLYREFSQQRQVDTNECAFLR